MAVIHAVLVLNRHVGGVRLGWPVLLGTSATLAGLGALAGFTWVEGERRTRATVSTAGRLEAKGLLMRTRSATDRRVVELTLTDQGRELTTKIPHHLAAVYNNHLAGFSTEEFNQLKQLLRRIISNRDNSV